MKTQRAPVFHSERLRVVRAEREQVEVALDVSHWAVDDIAIICVLDDVREVAAEGNP